MGNGLQGHWCPSFAHNQLQLPDVSGLGNHGTLVNFANNGNNALVTSGGKLALDFDNSNDQVSIPSIASIRSGPFTVSLWYYPFSVSGLNQIFAQWIAIGGFGMIGFRNGSALAWQVGNRVTTGAVFTANNWHHMVCFRQENGTLRAMINGVLDPGSTTATGQSSTEPFILGGPVGGAGTGAGNCQLDDIRIYSRALTVGEAIATYQANRGGGMGYQSPLRRSYFVPALPSPRRRSSRALAFPG
jgi:hypothetical protein